LVWGRGRGWGWGWGWGWWGGGGGRDSAGCVGAGVGTARDVWVRGWGSLGGKGEIMLGRERCIMQCVDTAHGLVSCCMQCMT
jgi:hypothetical protein